MSDKNGLNRYCLLRASHETSDRMKCMQHSNPGNAICVIHLSILSQVIFLVSPLWLSRGANKVNSYSFQHLKVDNVPIHKLGLSDIIFPRIFIEENLCHLEQKIISLGLVHTEKSKFPLSYTCFLGPSFFVPLTAPSNPSMLVAMVILSVLMSSKQTQKKY